MNQIIHEIKQIMEQNMHTYLPDVQKKDLEGNGAVFYMNGKNGTAFDWYVNEHLPYFYIFYNDKRNLGAAKLALYKDGNVVLYLFGDHGEQFIRDVYTSVDVSKDDVFRLAVTLKNEADDKGVWDADIDGIRTDAEIGNMQVEEFCRQREYMEPSINRIRIINQRGYLSKKIAEEGWKIGYMCRDEAINEYDSGWSFMAGNEEETYFEDPDHLLLVWVQDIYQMDPDIFSYIDLPAGTRLIRISSHEFEEDDNSKPIYLEKNNL